MHVVSVWDAAAAAAKNENVNSRPSLLIRLFLLVALALLPAILLLLAMQVDLREQRSAAARDQALRLARDASARLGRFVEGLREALVVLSEAPPVRNGDAAGCTTMLMQLKVRFADQILLGANGPDGWVLCTTAGTPPHTIYNGNRSFYRLPLQTGGFAVGEWEQGAVLRGGSLHFGLPILSSTGMGQAGTVGAAVGAEWLAELLRPIDLPPGAKLMVLDRNDRIVLHLSGGGPERLKPGDLAPPQLLQLFPPVPAPSSDLEPPGTAKLIEAPGLDGVPRLFGVAPFVPGTGGALRLAVSLDAQATLAPVREAERRGLLLILGGMMMAFLAAWAGARRFVLRPLTVLLDAAAQWERGRYEVRAAPALGGSTPELSRLAGALDRMAEAAEGRDRATAELLEKEARLSLALSAGGLAAWELDPESGQVLRSARHDALFGYDRPVAHWNWRTFLRHVLPEERREVEEAFRALRSGRGPLTLDFRIRRAGDGEIRWLEARGALHRGLDGREKVLGVLADVTERRRTEARLRLTVGELNHRVKNTLATVQSLAAQTLRAPAGSDGAIPAAARAAFEARLLALARSHDLLTREGWSGARLGELVALALAPHSSGAAGTRYSVGGPPLYVQPRLAVPLAVALHELATNAARHGALSGPEGKVRVTWRQDPPLPGRTPMLRIRWVEQGGPRVEGPPKRRGFGTRLLEQGLARELGGSVRLEFRPTGLVCEIEAPLRPQSPARLDAA